MTQYGFGRRAGAHDVKRSCECAARKREYTLTACLATTMKNVDVIFHHCDNSDNKTQSKRDSREAEANVE